jgi:hypothetical protein
MEHFPSDFSPENKDKFYDIRNREILKLLRKNIFHLVLKGNEKEFFDLEIFNRQHVHSTEITNLLANQVIEELHTLGWKTILSYGGTGLFIYSTEEPPGNAW